MVKTTGIRSEIIPAIDMQLNEMPFLVFDEIHSHPDWLFTFSILYSHLPWTIWFFAENLGILGHL